MHYGQGTIIMTHFHIQIIFLIIEITRKCNKILVILDNGMKCSIKVPMANIIKLL